MLNARALLSVRIKFFDNKFLMVASVEQHKKKFQVDLRASDRARLLLATTCRRHGPLDIFCTEILILWIRPIHLIVTAENFG